MLPMSLVRKITFISANVQCKLYVQDRLESEKIEARTKWEQEMNFLPVIGNDRVEHLGGSYLLDTHTINLLVQQN
jgi:hypothetical protein